MKKQATPYEPGLDVIRFFAFFAVFFTHFINSGGNAIEEDLGQWWNTDFIQRIAAFGGQGVTLFFGLTGFLLGRILIREFEVNGKINVRAFYMRRILRIWPLYFGFLIFCILLNTFANSPTITWQEIPYLLTFTYNWGQLFGSLPGTMATITWSVSVEEQIYLIFPLMFLLLVKKSAQNFALLLIFIGLGSIFLSLYIIEVSPDRFTPAFLLPVGVGLYCAVHEGKIRTAKPSRASKLYILGLLFSYIWVFGEIKSNQDWRSISYLGSGLILPCLLYVTKDIDLINLSVINRIFAYIGRRSYGCYLFHWAVWTVMVGKEIGFSKSEGFSILGVLIGMLSTIVISSFSYRFFEMPFLRSRKRFQQVESP
jgi:peptidoglycan/LPS O-acetylase OafA/YrhL